MHGADYIRTCSNCDIIAKYRHLINSRSSSKRYILRNMAILSNNTSFMNNYPDSLITNYSSFTNICLIRNYSPPIIF